MTKLQISRNWLSVEGNGDERWDSVLLQVTVYILWDGFDLVAFNVILRVIWRSFFSKI